MQLFYGTGNSAKLAFMRDCVRGLPLEILAPCAHPRVEESGASPLDNARLKARAYYDILRAPVFSCDSGLYIRGLPESEQPGVYLRRANGRELTDEEVIARFSAIAARLGGQCEARYRNAVCLYFADGSSVESMDDALSGAPFLLTAKAHPARRPGFPLDSISVHIPTGKYYFDLAQTRLSSPDAGYRAFFQRVLAL